jgi:hypothetical protein
MIAFMETNKDNLEDTTVQAELKTLKDSHINDLLPYITTDKQDEFKEFMANMKP